MTAKSGSQPQNGQWPCRQLREIGALQQRLGAAREKRPQRQHQHLIEARRRRAGVAFGGRRRSDAARSRRYQLRDERLERVAVAAERERSARARRARARRSGAGCRRSAGASSRKIGPLERNVAEADGRPPGAPAAPRARPGRAESTAAARAPGRAAASRRARAACRRRTPARAVRRFSCLSSTTSRGSARGARGRAFGSDTPDWIV